MLLVFPARVRGVHEVRHPFDSHVYRHLSLADDGGTAETAQIHKQMLYDLADRFSGFPGRLREGFRT